MDTKSEEVLNLADKITDAIQEDWATQYARGERTLGPSKENLQKQIEARYPEIGTRQVFKTIYGYVKYNNERGDHKKVREFPIEKVQTILRFLFVDMLTDSGWPNVVKAIRDFEDGKYFPLVEPYVSGTAYDKIQTVLSEQLLVRAGAASGESAVTQMLQLVLKMKEEFENKDAYIAQLEREKVSLEKAKADKAKKITLLRDEIAKWEGAIESGVEIDQAGLDRIEKLKQLLDLLS